jgi:hypothetical protein
MKTTTRSSRPVVQFDIVAQWQKTLRGDAQARVTLLRRIMPAAK